MSTNLDSRILLKKRRIQSRQFYRMFNEANRSNQAEASEHSKKACVRHFPVEINYMVCSYLSTDAEILNFALICRVAYNAVFVEQTIWRLRFLRTFDRPLIPTTSLSGSSQLGALEYNWKQLDMKRMYIERKRLLSMKIEWFDGRSTEEQAVCNLLRKMLTEAVTNSSLAGNGSYDFDEHQENNGEEGEIGDDDDSENSPRNGALAMSIDNEEAEGRNYTLIRKYCRESSFLDLKTADTDRLYRALLICLAPLSIGKAPSKRSSLGSTLSLVSELSVGISSSYFDMSDASRIPMKAVLWAIYVARFCLHCPDAPAHAAWPMLKSWGLQPSPYEKGRIESLVPREDYQVWMIYGFSTVTYKSL
jgi:hypothetical protein